MVQQRTNMTLANELLMLRISLGYEKQEGFAQHLGVSLRHYTRMEKYGIFSRKMLIKVRIQHPGFASSVHF